VEKPGFFAEWVLPSFAKYATISYPASSDTTGSVEANEEKRYGRQPPHDGYGHSAPHRY
jgi:hypothetical protein